MNTPVDGPMGWCCCWGRPGVLERLPLPIDCSAAPAEPMWLLPRLPAASPPRPSSMRGRKTPVEGPGTDRLACSAAAAATAAVRLLPAPPSPLPCICSCIGCSWPEGWPWSLGWSSPGITKLCGESSGAGPALLLGGSMCSCRARPLGRGAAGAAAAAAAAICGRGR
jgi:hypothetical protein